MPLFAEELRWFESDDGLLVSTLIQDTDDEFSAIILARDMRERFRFVSMTNFYASPDEALQAMKQRAAEVLPSLTRSVTRAMTKALRSTSLRQLGESRSLIRTL